MEVFAYLRVSGKGQLDGSVFDRQNASINAFCSKQKYELQQVFEEQVSGTAGEEDRQEFALVVSAILKNDVNTIIVESLDRLARDHIRAEQGKCEGCKGYKDTEKGKQHENPSASG